LTGWRPLLLVLVLAMPPLHPMALHRTLPNPPPQALAMRLLQGLAMRLLQGLVMRLLQGLVMRLLQGL
jgi:hypothetical protein